MNIFVSTPYSLESQWGGGGCGNYIILHHANVSIVDNILWHLDGPSEHTGSHEHWFQGCKVDLVTHPKL